MRHKRPDGYGGTLYSRGPERWARAAHNALVKPNSKGGRLYLQRTSIAFEVAEEARNSALFRSDTEFQHNSIQYTPGGAWDYTKKRDKVTCSVFCAVMTAQLEGGASTMKKVKEMFSTEIQSYKGGTWEDSGIPHIEPLDRTTLVRKVRCFYCGTHVHPKKKR
jgi:hypothetical protein